MRATTEADVCVLAGGFGRRKVAPRVCIVDRKPHLRAFLADALEEFRFVAAECAGALELPARLAEHRPDLLVIGSTIDGIEAEAILDTLAATCFTGSVLTIAPRETIMSDAIRRHGAARGLTMLSPLATPFSAHTLGLSLAPLLPQEPPPEPEVDATEALKAGWLELWYQRCVDAHSLTPQGAEALLRMRHPNWGVVSPSAFLPDGSDPHFRALSEFVITRVVADWHYLLEHQGPIDLSINLPVSFLGNEQALADLGAWMPQHPAFGGLIVEVDAAEVVDHLVELTEIAHRLRLRNVAIAIDKVGAEWPALMHLDAFPFVELKVDRSFVTGCADDRLKRSVCRRIVELAGDYGARCTATGIETRADFQAAHELGFDKMQGYLFGKPMGLKKFARAAHARPVAMHD
ncbi:EAL domain-containing protein [Rhodopseudomonas palustris]|uniref:EAL domain-containing response regulator n=1 Tax=Rhodopseudomonas palustris TaxID=1076 RepID=UPI00115E7106|nr:EAL domain-containing response regulator [Rhodopseudomonas palustris]QDL99044.1 EAL domain-containing protein [Rhodopseudomonas palustris]